MHLLAYPRETASLDGVWQAIPDQYEQFKTYFEEFADEDEEVPFDPIYDPDASVENDPCDFDINNGRSIRVPSSFGEEIPEFRHFEGWIWYAQRFDRSLVKDERAFLRFGAINYEAEVWLNGERLGTHEGGYTPFSFEITDQLRDGENVLVVRADNNRYARGITRSIELVSVPESFVRNVKVETTLAEDTVDVHIDTWTDGGTSGEPVKVEFDDLGIKFELNADCGSRFSGQFSVSISDITLWNPSNPRLYTMRVEYGDDVLEDRVGLWEISVSGSDILLNGEPIWLRGIALHEEAAGKGRALGTEDVEARFQWLSELGCNYGRLAHYPHTQEMARTADEEGILLWEALSS